MTDLAAVLLTYLQQSREAVVSRLDGVSEYDAHRPMTPSGTNLLGLVKHLASMEFSTLGSCIGRPREPELSWVADGSIWDGADMWATADETAHPAGHADIVRELLDGRGGPDHDSYGDAAYWSDYVATIEAAAATLR